jgi:hypothetical protein
VLLTLGKARWAELSDIYHTLVNDLQVSRTSTHLYPYGRCRVPHEFQISMTCMGACGRTPLAKLAPRLQWKVRRTLAYSIHEVARILGTDLTESELVPVFNSFAKDLDEVLSAAARHQSSRRCSARYKALFRSRLVLVRTFSC